MATEQVTELMQDNVYLVKRAGLALIKDMVGRRACQPGSARPRSAIHRVEQNGPAAARPDRAAELLEVERGRQGQLTQACLSARPQLLEIHVHVPCRQVASLSHRATPLTARQAKGETKVTYGPALVS